MLSRRTSGWRKERHQLKDWAIKRGNAADYEESEFIKCHLIGRCYQATFSLSVRWICWLSSAELFGLFGRFRVIARVNSNPNSNLNSRLLHFTGETLESKEVRCRKVGASSFTGPLWHRCKIPGWVTISYTVATVTVVECVRTGTFMELHFVRVS